MSARLTDNDIDIYLINNQKLIIRLGEYINAHHKLLWGCLICGYLWENTTSHIKNGSGCSKCSGRLPITNDIVDAFLTQKIRLED